MTREHKFKSDNQFLDFFHEHGLPVLEFWSSRIQQ
jgi:hypothetical protein